MKKLSKDRIKERDEIVDDLGLAKENLSSAIETYNEALSEQRDAVQAAVDEFNAAIERANTLMTEIEGEAQEYFDERSEKWQEGDAGVAYESWIEQFQDEIDGIDFDAPEEIEIPEGIDEAIERLEQLVESPGDM